MRSGVVLKVDGFEWIEVGHVQWVTRAPVTGSREEEWFTAAFRIQVVPVGRAMFAV